ncbi:MAG: flippase [Pseudomonadota bacterium]
MSTNAENAAPRGSSLTSGTLLARNAFFNFAGQGAPMLVAFFAIPLLIHGLGTDRFGILTLAWMVIGYFSLFDLGLGRALTQVVSEKLGAGQEGDVPALVWTGLGMMAVLGMIGAVAIAMISPWLVHSVLKIPLGLQAETLNSFYLLAASLPIVISTAGLVGVLASLQRFDIVNAIRIPMGAFSFLGPLLVLPFSHSLFFVILVLVFGRVLAWILHLFFCIRAMPRLRSEFSMQSSVVKPLFHFGGWMTVSNVIGPLMVYLDRFVIGALVSVAAVAYYATPYELVTKLWIIPGAIVGVLFPAFAASHVHDKARAALLFARGTKYVFLVLFPVVVILVAFAHEGLDLWLGAEFAQHSTPVLQWLAVGVFINSMAHTPFALVQGAGRPDLTAKLHLIELPIYLFLLLWLLHLYGIVGAAMAWTLRVTLDTTLLFWMSSRLLEGLAIYSLRFAMLMISTLLGLGALVLPMQSGLKWLLFSMVLIAFAVAAWLLILDQQERTILKSLFRKTFYLEHRHANHQ